MTRITPWRRTILQLSQRRVTEAATFIAVSCLVSMSPTESSIDENFNTVNDAHADSARPWRAPNTLF